MAGPSPPLEGTCPGKKARKGERGGSPTFVLFFGGPHLLDLLRGLHEEREDGAEAQNVHKLMAVVGPLRPDHGVVQDLQGAAPGDLLLSEGKGELGP